jgi:chemotaxis response regulator CheB
VPVEPVRVLVVYSHPLLGEGLAGMLAAQPSLAVCSVNVESRDAVEAALATEPDVIVVEEGGPFDAADVLRGSRAPVVVAVDIGSADAWTLQRRSIRSRPDDVIQAVLDALVSEPSPPQAPPKPSARVRRVRPAALSG